MKIDPVLRWKVEKWKAKSTQCFELTGEEQKFHNAHFKSISIAYF